MQFNLSRIEDFEDIHIYMYNVQRTHMPYMAEQKPLDTSYFIEGNSFFLLRCAVYVMCVIG